MSANNISVARQSNPARRSTVAWLSTMFAAVLAPSLVWFATVPIAGHELVARVGPELQHVELGAVTIGSAIAASLGMGLASVLRRFHRFRRIWTIVALIALALSLLTPLGGTTTITVLVLLGMHLIVGGIVIAGGLALPVPSRA